jgi:hypothetical protein
MQHIVRKVKYQDRGDFLLIALAASTEAMRSIICWTFAF